MKEIRAMTDGERMKQLTALREQARDLTFKLHSKEVKNMHSLKAIKQDIARILTFLNEK